MKRIKTHFYKTKNTLKNLQNLSIKDKPLLKTKQEYKREALMLINKSRRHLHDSNHKFYVFDVVKGLCEDLDFVDLNEIIKGLQRIKSNKRNENFICDDFE